MLKVLVVVVWLVVDDLIADRSHSVSSRAMQNALRILSEACSWVRVDLSAFDELVKSILILVLTSADVVSLANQRLSDLHLRTGVLIEKSLLRASRWLVWVKGLVIGLVWRGRVHQGLQTR